MNDIWCAWYGWNGLLQELLVPTFVWKNIRFHLLYLSFQSAVALVFPTELRGSSTGFPLFCIGNGNIIAGNKDVYTALGQTPNAWFLSVKQHEVEIPATPDKPNGESKALHQVNLTWKKDKTNYRTWKLKGYNVYCDGEKAATLKDLNDEMATTLKDVEPGYRNFSIEAILQR